MTPDNPGNGTMMRWAVGLLAGVGVTVAIFMANAQGKNNDLDRQQGEAISGLKSDVAHLQDQSDRIEANTQEILRAVTGGR